MTLFLERRRGADRDLGTAADAAVGSRHVLRRLEALERPVTVTDGADRVTGSSSSPTSVTETELPWWRRALSALLTILIVVGAVYLWPARLGGATRLVIVSGTSMEPVYDLGDVVIARDDSPPEVGDIVVFEVPDGEPAAGMLVIHRIIDIDADGYFVTQGDNRDTPDHWQLAADDMVGEPLVHLPKAGLAIFFLRQWWVLTAILGLLVMFLLWPSARNHAGDHADDHLPGLAPVPRRDGPHVARLAEHHRGHAIPPDVMADAEAWLDAQLSAVLAGDPA